MEKKEQIEQLIKENLKASSKMLPSKNCPSELELIDYLENRLAPEKENQLLEHIADCGHCLSILQLALKAEDAAEERPSIEMLARAKNIWRPKPKKRIFQYKWQILAAISFIFSFLLTHFFLQFLILAVIFSLKWIFDTASTHTLIMIYEAWRKKDKGTAQRIIEDLQDKIEQRR